jgi:DNA-binding CsgD family transcriptional regulator
MIDRRQKGQFSGMALLVQHDPRMTEDQREAIHHLWDELSDFPVSQAEQALMHLMKGICEMIGAGNAYWLGYIRFEAEPGDPLKGLRPGLPPGANRYLYPSRLNDASSRAQTIKWNRNQVNEGFLLVACDVGKFRSFRLRKEMRPAYFEEEFYQAFHASRGFHDQCVVIFPVNADYESLFNFQRVGVRKNFTATEEAIAAYALRGIRWFHRQLALSHGLLIAETPLSPAQRQITQLLLTERSEKEIAAEIGKSLRTTHNHITEVFRKFGVQSRAGLMSLWLGAKGK